jgi:hypothetical protein
MIAQAGQLAQWHSAGVLADTKFAAAKQSL